jgi:site-specific recombinase XerD
LVAAGPRCPAVLNLFRSLVLAGLAFFRTRHQLARRSVMGKLKDKMDGDLKLRGLYENTRATYLRCAEAFVKHYMKPPAVLGKTEVRDYLLLGVEERKWAPSTYNVHAAALRFLYSYTLERPEEVAWIGQMRVPHRLPAILSPEEVERLLGALGSLRMQAIVMTAYGAGLRVSEVLNLRVEDIDSRRMVIHVRHGKGDRDRFTMLPRRLLETLRAYWKEARPPGPELFAGRKPGTLLQRATVNLALKQAALRAGIKKRVRPHSLRHALFCGRNFFDELNGQAKQPNRRTGVVQDATRYEHTPDV